MGSAQDGGEKIFRQRDFNAMDPVKFVNLSAANKPVSLGEKFNGGPDWLRSTQIRLKNVSSKDIVYIGLEFNFPETKSSGLEMSYRAQLGNMPELPVAFTPLSLKPQEEALFSFSDEEYQGLVNFIAHRNLIVSRLNETDLKIGFVVFSDSTAWGTGIWFKPNPDKRNSWIPISPQPRN